MTHTVLVTDYTWASTDREAAVLGEAGASLLVAESGSEAELVELARQADAILTCFATVTAAVIRAAPNLQVIGRYGIGVDNIDVAEATRGGVIVANVPEYCADEVASHALALLLALARKVHLFDRAVHDGNWALQAGAPMYRIGGATLGIVGFGRIGQTVARKARALDLRVLACDPGMPDEVVASQGAEPVDLAGLARRSDFITVHAPLTEATRGLIGREFLQLMKPSAYLINTARAGLVDQDALVDALHDRRIAGAGLDVVYPEHLPAGHPLLALPNVLITPHVAFYSEESVRDLAVLAARNVAAVLTGNRPDSVINPEVLAMPRWAHLSRPAGQR